MEFESPKTKREAELAQRSAENATEAMAEFAKAKTPQERDQARKKFKIVRQVLHNLCDLPKRAIHPGIMLLKAKMKRKSILEAALEYATKGWPVFPVNRRNKKPHIVKWQSTGASTDPKQIKRWWQLWPKANVAIVCGKCSGIVAIDIDESKLPPELQRLSRSMTAASRTGGGGRHFYFQAPDEPLRTRQFDNFEVKAEGSNATLPPSLHKSGKQYKWIRDCEPKPVPEWLLKLILEETEETTKTPLRHKGLIEEHQPSRHTEMYALAGYYRGKRGMNQKQILANLKQDNERCRPPLRLDELEDMAERASEYEIEKEVLKPHKLARQLLRKFYTHKDNSTLQYFNGLWYLWEGTHYFIVLNKEMKAKINRQLHELHPTISITRTVCEDATAALAGFTLVEGTNTMPCWLDNREQGRLAAMENGLLDMEATTNRKLYKHTPLWFNATYMDYEYDPKAKCPRWLKFLEQVLPSRQVLGKPVNEEVMLLQEFFGYCTTLSCRYQKALAMLGPGANGKSVVAEILIEMLGVGNVSTLTFEQFGDRFTLANTIGKNANITSERELAGRIAEQTLKRLIDATPIEVERKNVQPFKAIPTAKLIFSMNNLPLFRDTSWATFRRWRVIPFRIVIQEEEQARHLAEEICENELPGILNWAFEGLKRLNRTQHFTNPQSSQKLIEAIRRKTNPTREYLLTHCKESIGSTVPCKIILELCRSWCKENNKPQPEKAEFGKEFKATFPNVEKARPRIRLGKRQYHYKGIKIL